MGLRESYAAFGGDFEKVVGDLGGSEDRVLKYCNMFLDDDDSFEGLGNAFAQGNMEEAYRCAHTLKGLSNTLGFTHLYESSAALSDALKHNELDNLNALVDAVNADYHSVVSALRSA